MCVGYSWVVKSADRRLRPGVLWSNQNRVAYSESIRGISQLVQPGLAAESLQHSAANTASVAS